MENQPVLIDVPTNTPPIIPMGFYLNKPRPNAQSDEVLAMVAAKLMPSVVGWLRLDAEDEDYEQAAKEYSEDLLLALEVSSDGYKMANYLESRHNWDSDSELVDILKGVDFHGLARTAVMAWIRDNDKKALLFPGRLVEVSIPRDKTRHEGVITKVYEDGNYCVMIPNLGHVAQGIGTRGMIFTWEAVEGWNLAESV